MRAHVWPCQGGRATRLLVHGLTPTPPNPNPMCLNVLFSLFSRFHLLLVSSSPIQPSLSWWHHILCPAQLWCLSPASNAQTWQTRFLVSYVTEKLFFLPNYNVLSLHRRKEGTRMAVKTRANEGSICRIFEIMKLCVCVYTPRRLIKTVSTRSSIGPFLALVWPANYQHPLLRFLKHLWTPKSEWLWDVIIPYNLSQAYRSSLNTAPGGQILNSWGIVDTKYDI